MLMLIWEEQEAFHLLYKKKFGGFLCIFFFFSYFVTESSVFEVKIPALKTYFYVVVFLEFSSFPHSGFIFVCQHGLCSTVTGLRYCGRLRETDIKLSYYYYYCTFGKRKENYSGKL